MHRRQPLPRLWLMTDERQGDDLWTAIARLPRGAGIVFRHYSLPEPERRALFERVKAAGQKRGLILLAGGTERWGGDGTHGRGRRLHGGLRTAPVHNMQEIRAAERSGADAVFLSPVFATRSHPGAEPLGPFRFRALARRTELPVIALGGMNADRARKLGVYGWAAIDAWSV